MGNLAFGIDIGTVSVKWVLAGSKEQIKKLAAFQNNGIEKISEIPGKSDIAFAISKYRRVQGGPLAAVKETIREVSAYVEWENLGSIVITGSSSGVIGKKLNIPVENEFKTVTKGVAAFYPDVVNIFEMGGENSKYIKISRVDGIAGIEDYETNGDCAAGTGSFMDQQANRLQFDIDRVGNVVMKTVRSPKIAGRCSVFAKSDMIHAQQKGYKPDEILKGLSEAVARNFKSNIAKGKNVTGRTVFVGGVALNAGVARAIREVFELDEDDFFVPDECVHLGAIGAALLGRDDLNGSTKLIRESVEGDSSGHGGSFPSLPGLSRKRVQFMRDKVALYSFSDKNIIPAFLGIDVGSVSTNLALIDSDGSVIKEIYLRTRARPIEVVDQGLQEMKRELTGRVDIRGVGTTGSGRELIGKLMGADTINDEITAHKTGASFVGKRLLNKEVDTIFEIGGQDSKFISIEDGIVIDFTMNDACAAGTGSFLEEQAEKLDIQIIDEFAQRAFASEKPLRMGERCTVYMEKDVTSYLKRGALKNDVIAGLAYSVVQNYLNRVVRGRKIGDSIFFQGGTAYNDSVAAAFSEVLGKEIIVPPHNGVIGAIGSALLAKEKVQALESKTTFRGYDISEIDYSIREFTCKGCANYCNIQEFTVEGERTYWGDKCSRYRKRAEISKKAVIPDLLSLYEKLLTRDAVEAVSEELERDIDCSWKGKNRAPRIGLPRTMYYYDRHPFWSTYLRTMGFEIITSIDTNREIVHMGIGSIVADPCFPIQIAHGHAVSLLEEELDSILIPNVIDSETDTSEVKSFLCPWGQTLPFILRSTPAFRGRRDLIADPTVHFREGEAFVEKELWKFAKPFGVKRVRHREAVKLGYTAQKLFRRELSLAGSNALDILNKSDELGIVLVGRPYNIMDAEANMGTPGKLRDYYGINVIPCFFLPLEGIDVMDVGYNMFWNYGRAILQSARYVDGKENLHLIYITNFKCGPDSYIKSYVKQVTSKPFLTLQFDSHSNDAGIMTRCEAYLDSKGVLRWWAGKRNLSRGERFTSRECPTERQEPLRRHSNISG
jgi:predicted CoA-substrate-specific enzyme activase